MRPILLTAALTCSFMTLAVPAHATFPGQNGPIAFRQFGPEQSLLVRARPDGTDVSVITGLPGLASDWRADGRRVAFDFFEPDGDQQIATARPDGSNVRVITSGPGIHEVPSWSPDGRSIVFDYSPTADPDAPGFETRLWTMRSNGSRPRPLPMHRPGFDVEPRYSPSGRWITFARLRPPLAGSDDWQAAIMIVPADGGIVRQLTPWGAFVEHPTWSPDSRQIIFNTPEGTIESIRPDGTRRHTIRAATEHLGGHKPWFSPDGSRILFVCAITDPDGRFTDDICTMNADGSDVINLTNTANVFENNPSWGPAPDRHRKR